MDELKDDVYDALRTYANEYGEEKTLKLLCRIVGAFVKSLDQEGAVITDPVLGTTIDISITNKDGGHEL